MTPIFADAGIPMLFFHLPAMALALVPVVATEWFVAIRQIGLPKKKAIKGVVIANCFSTLLGFPLFWLIGVLVMVLIGPPLAGALPESPSVIRQIFGFAAGMIWMGPEPVRQHIVWAGLAILVPAFFVSVFSERWILRSIWPEVQPGTLSSFAWSAHLFSYPVLIVVWLCYVFRVLRVL